MIDEKHRHEIAEAMRRCDPKAFGWPMGLAAAIAQASDGGQDPLHELADLIDREAYDTRIPYRLNTTQYCEYENDGEYVHMGDTVEVAEDIYSGQLSYVGELLFVEYDVSDGLIEGVTIANQSSESGYVHVACEGVFFKPEEGVCDAQ